MSLSRPISVLCILTLVFLMSCSKTAKAAEKHVTLNSPAKKEGLITQSFIKSINQYNYAESFSEGLALVEKDRKFGYVDKEGFSTFNNVAYDNRNIKKGTVRR